MNVEGSEIAPRLPGPGLGRRARHNLHPDMAARCRYAVGRRYLPRDHEETSPVPAIKEPAKPVEVFTPAALVELLCHTPERLIPFKVLGAFAGIRHVEIQRLQWEDVIVAARKAKTASCRSGP
jgi:hypothetical protein